jgi:hypothetical protein
MTISSFVMVRDDFLFLSSCVEISFTKSCAWNQSFDLSFLDAYSEFVWFQYTRWCWSTAIFHEITNRSEQSFKKSFAFSEFFNLSWLRSRCCLSRI